MAAFESTYDTTTNVKADWRGRAACKNLPPEVAEAYINEKSPGADEAKKKCAMCLVRKDCLTEAVEDPDAQGMRGGFFFDGGRVTLDDAPTIRKTFHLDPRMRQRPRRVKAQTV